MRHFVAASILALLTVPLGADTIVLVDGDRVSGRILAKGSRRIRVQTPYGVLAIPRDKIDHIRHDDGTEEVLRPKVEPPTPAPKPTPPPAVLLLSVGGASFWHAWDPKAAPADPSLRLSVELDGRPAAAFVDANLDPEDLPKAVVNSFVFAADRLFVEPGLGTKTAPPELQSGRIGLTLELPAALSGERRLRLAYQVNDSSSAEPRWRDVVEATAQVALAGGRTTLVRVEQERGLMEYTRRQMQNVDTFRVQLLSEEGAPPVP